MSTALPLGFFQFDNLVRNRVPFYLLRLNIDVESLYGKMDFMEKQHLRNYSLELSEFSLSLVEPLLKERHAQKDSPLVVLDSDGLKSSKFASELASAGYLNVYFVVGGFLGLQAEKAEA
jgi:rhodanese-related sulfurtransferase